MFYSHEHNVRTTQSEINKKWPTLWPNKWEQFEKYLSGRNLNSLLAKVNNWYPSRNAGDAKLRIVIPAITHVPGHVYWQARLIGKYGIRYQSPKGPRCDALIYVKPWFDKRNANVIVEGPMDSLAAAEYGFHAFSLMGVQPPDSTIRFLSSMLEGNETYLILDRDALQHGPRIAARIASQGIKIEIVTLWDAKDLAAMDKSDRTLFFRWLTKCKNLSPLKNLDKLE